MPRVSVIIPSYNHEAFVAESVRSVLDQTGVEVEVVVCDDASTDRSVEILRGMHDPRLKLLVHDTNAGASTAARHALAAATGDYVARLGSDDVCLPGRLALQAEYLQSHPEVGSVLGQPEFINDQSQPIPPPPLLDGLFALENRPRQAWLQRFFDHGNCFCMPTSMFRRAEAAMVAPPRDTFRHLPDFEYWVRHCLKAEVHILPEKVTGFRLRSDHGNLSAPALDKEAEKVMEELAVLRYFIDPEGLAALGLEPDATGRLALAERAMAVGRPAHRLFALLTAVETDFSGMDESAREQLAQRASTLLRGSDAIEMLSREKLRASNAALRLSRDKARQKLAALESELEQWRSSWLGRWFGKRLKKEARPKSKDGEAWR
ncbi:MAG TPA: glycosyltransferase family A protein [Verrucomicrobium sp.]|nr:glycosyltransferase family A protein [Verrucomicrobium sp.]